MLVRLFIQQMGLIEEAHIEFEKGLNILSGETGAGKTILIQAISLTLGQKGDASIIREGASQATIEAIFNVDHLNPFLHEMGIEATDYLIIKREIVREGKGRSFINGRMVPLSMVQKVGENLFELISQNAQGKLRDPHEQLKIIDHYGHHDLKPLQEKKKEKQLLEHTLHALQQTEVSLEFLKFQLSDFESLNLQEGEIDTLEEELKNLQEKEKRLSELKQVEALLPENLTHTLGQLSHTLKKLSLSEGVLHMQQAILSLNEVSYLIARTLDETEFDEHAYARLEERMSTVHRMQKKYGPDLLAVQKKLTQDLTSLEQKEEKIEELHKKISIVSQAIEKLEHLLEEERQKTSLRLAKAVTEELTSLNMPGATFSIENHLFYLSANRGEKKAALKDKTSGGELSRILFILKLLLKEEVPTLIFDEIDANIGGETAALFGEKLKMLGKERQVIAITHFPQVACEADHHLKVHKEEKGGRTIAHITKLSKDNRPKELLRMLGGKQIITALLFMTTSLFGIDYTLGSNYSFVNDRSPMVLEGYFSPMAQASMKHDVPGHMNYSEAALAAFYNFYFGKDHALSFEVGYSQMNLNWKENPRFNEQHFHTGIFTAGYVTTAIENWRYVLMTGAHIQMDHSSAFGVGTLWGRYKFSEDWGFHVGFTGQGNQFKCYFFPILGFDWRMRKNIFANIVFPLDFSLHFFLSPEWDIAASYRSFGGWYRSFMKADNNQAFTIHGNGADVGIYYRSKHVELALYAGPAFGGWIEIKNQHYPQQGDYYKFNWAPFAGAQAKFVF